jgi:hypothetical protein
MPLRGRSRWSLKRLLPMPPVWALILAIKATLRAPLRSGLDRRISGGTSDAIAS